MSTSISLSLRPVDKDNWRLVTSLEVHPEQRAFVSDPSYYLALCCYSIWNPLAVYSNDLVVGFLMWAVDTDGSYWLGGILVDKKYQRNGYGRTAVQEAINMLSKEQGATRFALSYQPDNHVAKHLYGALGFVETGEREENEVVARSKIGTP